MNETVLYAVMTLTVCLWCVLRGPKGAPFLGLAVFLNWAIYLYVMTQWSGWLEQNDQKERFIYILIDLVLGTFTLGVIVKNRFGRNLFCGVSAAYGIMFSYHFGILGDESHVDYHGGLNLAYVIELISLFMFMSVVESKKRSDEFYKWRTSHRVKKKRWHHN